MNNQNEYKGILKSLVVAEKGIIIKEFAKPERFIPYSSIVSVQFQKAGDWKRGWGAGFIKFTLKDNSSTKDDENMIKFQTSGNNNAKFEEAKNLIIEKIS